MNNNSKLRDVIAKAKANNMPNDTIERGINFQCFPHSAKIFRRRENLKTVIFFDKIFRSGIQRQVDSVAMRLRCF